MGRRKSKMVGLRREGRRDQNQVCFRNNKDKGNPEGGEKAKTAAGKLVNQR